MKRMPLAKLLPVLFTACSETTSEPVTVVEQPVGLVYPVTDTVDHVDNYHGTSVPDPYR